MASARWRLGLLVARNVVKAPGRVTAETLAPKVKATTYAEMAGTSTPRVLRYLDAWEAAADAGLVPHAADLTPGQDVELDVDALDDWATFYPPGDTNLHKAGADARERYERAGV